jgi:hypothetical protein
MDEVSFPGAKIVLPAYWLKLIQQVPLEEQQKLRTQVDAPDLTAMDDDLRSLNLGLLLINAVGPGVLEAAVRDLGAGVKDGVQGSKMTSAQRPPPGPANGVRRRGLATLIEEAIEP